jgi:hypothetical protein
MLRAGLSGDHLRAITPVIADKLVIEQALREAGFENFEIEQVEATLEDVFLALAHRNQA